MCLLPILGNYTVSGMFFVSFFYYPSTKCCLESSVFCLDRFWFSNELLQPKIQDELIAREIVINDADPSVRYRLTKRQTQEEVNIVNGFCKTKDDSKSKCDYLKVMLIIIDQLSLFLQIQKSTGAVVITR